METLTPEVISETKITTPKKKKPAKKKKKILLGKLIKTGTRKKPKVKGTKKPIAKKPKAKIVPVKFDYKQLSADILAKREKEDLSFTDVQNSHGIARHILFSIEAGKMVPSCVNFAAVLTWLGKPANAYFITVKK